MAVRWRAVTLLCWLLCWCCGSLWGSPVVSTTHDTGQRTASCRGEDGASLDWFVLCKLPRLENSPEPLVRQGVAYAFLTSANTSSEWKLSTLSVNDPLSMPGRTLQPMYTSSGQVNLPLWLLYNDQPPNSSVSESHGHTKGVVLVTSPPQGAPQGVWLVHSVPHFPPTPIHQTYSFPSTGHHYGQTFLCMTLAATQIQQVGVQLGYNYPLVYSFALPSAFANITPSLAGVVRGEHIKNSPFHRQSTLQSVGGQHFLSFAKTSAFGKDLYADWVSPTLGTDLLVESWPNGPGRLAPSCQSKYRTENIRAVNISRSAGGMPYDLEFKNQKDHSKWAVADPGVKQAWLCVGDINRMESQEERGGGTVCFVNGGAWRAFHGAVTELEACPHSPNFL